MCFDLDALQPMHTTCTVHEPDPEPTGLLDQYGHPLIRQREPIGFRLSGQGVRNDNAHLPCLTMTTDTMAMREDRG